MKYYHVAVETNNPNKEYFQLNETDLSKIKERIVVPYLKGEILFVNGSFPDGSKVTDVVIKESDFTAQELANMWNQKYSNGNPQFCEKSVVWADTPWARDILGQICEEYEDLIKERLNKPTAPMDK